MNERIKELSGKALDIAIPETYTEINLRQFQKFRDTFAELIIKECASLLENAATDKRLDLSPELFKLINNISKAQAEYICEHFGVER